MNDAEDFENQNIYTKRGTENLLKNAAIFSLSF
jgi:hypothetical protein